MYAKVYAYCVWLLYALVWNNTQKVRLQDFARIICWVRTYLQKWILALQRNSINLLTKKPDWVFCKYFRLLQTLVGLFRNFSDKAAFIDRSNYLSLYA